MRRRDLIAALAGGTIAIALAGGIAWAASPGDGGVIQGCYDSGGNVKVVPALPCPEGYTPLAWNQQGPSRAGRGPAAGLVQLRRGKETRWVDPLAESARYEQLLTEGFTA